MEGMEKEMEEEFGLTWSDGIALKGQVRHALEPSHEEVRASL